MTNYDIIVQGCKLLISICPFTPGSGRVASAIRLSAWRRLTSACGNDSPALPKELLPFRTTLLVTGGRAFYNPSKTALETEVAWYTHPPGAQPPKRAVLPFASKRMSIDLQFGNSQEH
jgi:hypothetical protein